MSYSRKARLLTAVAIALVACSSQLEPGDPSLHTPDVVMTEGAVYRATSQAFQTQRVHRLATAAGLTATAELITRPPSTPAATIAPANTATLGPPPDIDFPDYSAPAGSLSSQVAQDVSVLLELHFPPDVVAFSAAEKYENGVTTYLAAAGYEDGQVVVWDSSMSTPRRSIQIGEGRIRTLELDPSGLFLLVLDEARRLTVLESTEWQVIESHELEVDGPFLFSPDATTIASLDTSQENIVLFGRYEAEPERIIRNNLAYYSAFTHLYGPYEFWSNGTLVTLGVDLQRGLFLRLPQDGVELLLPYDFSDGDFSIPDAFSTTRDGHGLAVGLASGDLFLWDVSSQEQTAVLRGHNTQSADGWLGAFIELEFSHDATLLLSIGWDGTTRLWNLTSMSVARVIESCCFAEVSGSGEVFFTLDQDTGLLRVWGVSNK